MVAGGTPEQAAAHVARLMAGNGAPSGWLTDPLAAATQPGLASVASASAEHAAAMMEATFQVTGTKMDLVEAHVAHEVDADVQGLADGAQGGSETAIRAAIERGRDLGLSPQETAGFVLLVAGLEASDGADGVLRGRAAGLLNQVDPESPGTAVATLATARAVALASRADAWAATSTVTAAVTGQSVLLKQQAAQGLITLSAGMFDGSEGPLAGPPAHPNCLCFLEVYEEGVIIYRRWTRAGEMRPCPICDTYAGMVV